MPVEVEELQYTIPANQPPRKRWTRGECAAAEAAGLFQQEKLELVEGELISKMGKNRPHVSSVILLYAWMIRAFGARFVAQESPIDVAADDNPVNEPEPDLIAAKSDITKFRSNPKPHDVRLLVEVSDTSLAFDLKVKAPLYARAGIQEYWVLDVQKRRLIVHRNPQLGRYTFLKAYGEDETVSPVSAPGEGLLIRDVLVEMD